MGYQIPFWDIAAGLRKRLSGLSGGCHELALAAVERAGSERGDVYLSLRSAARDTGLTPGCVSKCRAKLVEMGVLERVRGCLYRLVAVSASKRATTQKVKSSHMSVMERLKVLFYERIQSTGAKAIVRSDVTQDQVAKVVRGRVLPDWSREAEDLRRRGVSVRMAEALARAFKSMRIGEVLLYVDRKGMGPGAAVDALLKGWAVA